MRAQVEHDQRVPPTPQGGGTPETLRVWLLGGFSVSVGSQSIGEYVWHLRKARSLMKLLALAPGHRLHREQMMDLLWPESGREAAANNLRQALHVARRALESDPSAPRYLISHGEHLSLCPDGPLWVDVEVFEEATASARRLRDPQAYRAALDLYAGELLPEDPYEEWAEERRGQLRQIYLNLLIEMAELCEDRGDLGSAIEALRVALSEEPEHEQAHAELMLLYAKSDQRYQALRQYERLRQVLRRELGTEPGRATRRLHEEIVAGHLPVGRSASPEGIPSQRASSPIRHNVPAALSSFVGRERELVEVKRALAMTRVLTLTGSGGCGKTRLAMEVGRDLASSYPDGAWLVELASLSQPELVPQAVASVLGVREQPDRPLVDTLVGHLRGKDLLLILDNCEHLIEACTRLVHSLLHCCQHLRVLATSREPLGVEGEALWRVSSLSVPDTDRLPTASELTRYDAVRLFVDRARLRVPDFELTPENGQAVAQVCGRLEGIPLAIELATARVGVLAVEEVARRLGDSLSLLSAGPRTAPPRHRTMRATLEWSYGLLSKPESELFRRLSVFAGGFTLEAAEGVCAGGSIREGEVLDLHSSLVDKSLVVFEELQDGVARYRLQEPVRQYASERLEESGEADAFRRRHAEFFLAMAEEAEPELAGAQQQGWAKRLETNHDNMRAALSWSLEQEPETALRLAGALARFWEIRARFVEGSAWLEAALRQGGHADAARRAKLFSEAGTFAFHRADFERAVILHGEALALYRELGNDSGVAWALLCLGTQHLERGDNGRAAPLFEAALALSRRIGDRRTIAYALHNLAEVARQRGNYERAKTLGMEGMALCREMEDKYYLARITGWVGMLAVWSGDDHDSAEGFLKEGLALNREMGDWEYGAFCLEGFAGLAGARVHGVRAARLWGAAETLRSSIGAPLPPEPRPYYRRSMAAARTLLGEAAWDSAFAEGSAMSADEAVEYALSEEVAPAPESPPADRRRSDLLTRRERQIAELVARDLTNRQIAKELVLSERTVDKHVANLLKKLRLHSREQVAASMSERRAHLS